MKLFFALSLLIAFNSIKAQKGFYESPIAHYDTVVVRMYDDSAILSNTIEVEDIHRVDYSVKPPSFTASAFLAILPSKEVYEKQKFGSYLKAHTTSYTLTFLSGMASGMRDVCLFHFNNGESWWNGKTSWKRKYKNGDYIQGPAFWGSTGIFVAVTDGPHFFNMLDTEFSSFALATAPAGSKKIGRIIRDALIYTGIRLVGRVVVYNGFFNPKNY